MAEDNERYEKVWFCRVCKKTIKFEAFACKHEILHGSGWKIPSINTWYTPKKRAVRESNTTKKASVNNKVKLQKVTASKKKKPLGKGRRKFE
jgi:hypothetical protein